MIDVADGLDVVDDVGKGRRSRQWRWVRCWGVHEGCLGGFMGVYLAL